MNVSLSETSPHPKWLRRLPNQLTLLRIFCIPLVVWLMLQGDSISAATPFAMSQYDLWAGFVFAFAAATDAFDGYIARKFKVESLLGKLLDPLADKLLVVSALIILVDKHRLPSWIAVVLIVRDLGINAVRIAALEEKLMIPSSWMGKIKTILLDIGITALIIYGTVLYYLSGVFVGNLFIWAALIASVVSGAQYLWDYARFSKAAAE